MQAKLVHYYVHGRGRGHGTRTLKVVETLGRAGFSTRIFAGEDPQPLIASTYPVSAVESLMPGRPFQWVRLLGRRVDEARAEIRKDRPFVLISDGDLPSLLAARAQKVPSIAVGHAEVFGQTRRPKEAPRLPWLKEKLVAKISSFSAERHVAVNFVRTEPLNPKTLIARPATEWIVRDETPSIDVVCYFRDDNGERILNTLLDMGLRVTLFSKRGQPFKNATVHVLHRDAFLHALASTRMVAASAGSQLLSECTASGIPLFALFRKNDDEQRLNTAMLKAAGLGDGMSFEQFEPATLRAFVGGLEHGTCSPAMTRSDDTVDKVVLGLAASLFETGHFQTV